MKIDMQKTYKCTTCERKYKVERNTKDLKEPFYCCGEIAIEVQTDKPEVLSAEELSNLLENAPDNEVRERRFVLPVRSLREEQALFEHQVAALEAFKQNSSASGIIHLPTGAGKTRVAIQIISDRLKLDMNSRIIWATYPKILIRQAMLRIVEQSALFPQGTTIRWSEANTRDPDLLSETHITFLMRDDLMEYLNDSGDDRIAKPALREALAGRIPPKCKNITLIYDECHQLGAEKLQQAWRKFLDKQHGKVKANMQTIGFSATPLPTNAERHKLLQEHIFPVDNYKTAKPEWKMLVHASIDNEQLVERKVLCPINLCLQNSGIFDIPLKLLNEAGLDKITQPGPKPSKDELNHFTNDFNNNIFKNSQILEFLAGRLATNMKTLGKTLVFLPTIAAANDFAHLLKKNALVGAGNVSFVHSRLDEFSDELGENDLSATDVHAQMHAFRKKGHSPCIMVNVGMLTTGFDDPKIRTIVLSRLTFSTNLFWQMIGRGTRGLKCGGTTDCIVIDPIRLTERFEFLEGYRPKLKQPDYSSTDKKIEDSELGGEESALDPRVPSVQTPLIPSDLKPKISPEMQKDLAEALRAFLEGAPLDFNVAKNISIRSAVEGTDTVVTEFVQHSQTDSKTEPAYTSLLNIEIDRLENELRSRAPGVDLSWFKAEHMPSTSSLLDHTQYLKKLALVRDHKLTTRELFIGYMINLLN